MCGLPAARLADLCNGRVAVVAQVCIMRPGAPLSPLEHLDSITVSGDGHHLAVGSSQRQGFWLYTLKPPEVRLNPKPIERSHLWTRSLIALQYVFHDVRLSRRAKRGQSC